jgi:hypothetical protein
MRWALALVLLAGCPHSGSPDCITDFDCDPDVCARDKACHPASEVRSVTALWTIAGQKASATSCANTPDFYIRFRTNNRADAIGFSPVPCVNGQFLMDKLPTTYFKVELGVDNSDGFGSQVKPIDSNNVATFDMMF